MLVARSFHVPAYGKILYTRNYLSICRGVSLGLFLTAPFVVMAFLSDFEPLIKYTFVGMQVFGIVDVLISLSYHDKLN